MNTACGKTRDFIKELQELTSFQFASNGIAAQFPEEIANLREEDLAVEKAVDRRDFRGEKAFTIDCEDCKDMDDAVCVSKTPDGYRLGVHIADVAAFVPFGSMLDKIASRRCTSIYLPGMTVPMLPGILSNNSCSLNPGVSRYTLSVVISLNDKGEVLRSLITKGIIRSRVKGVYSEINRMLAGDKSVELVEKYSEVYDELKDMAALYRILRRERIRRGANTEDDNKSKITVCRHDIQITPTKEGVAENMIEEFMILANRIVAEFLFEKKLPAIYRIQEEKNHMAAYRPVKLHHAELALESYSHFTSPIRRIADLKIHQVISMYLNGIEEKAIHSLFDETLPDLCDLATRKSRTAKQIQSRCERYCFAQYFLLHRKERYIGKYVGLDRRQRPLILISEYNLVISAGTVFCGKVGNRYSFEVAADNFDRGLFARKIQAA